MVSGPKTSAFALIIVLLVYSLLAVSSHYYTRLTADTMLYISIAQKYLAGDFANAVNGYWGPLLSWLLLPLLYLKTSDVFAINALDLIMGILTIIGVWVLSYRYDMSERIRIALLIALCPVVLRMSIVQPMDFLLLCLLVFYLCIVFNQRYSAKSWHGVASGLLGACAYLTKAYAFPFFIVHFAGMNVFHCLKDRSGRGNVLKHAIAGFLAFFLVSGIWISLISIKYGHFTFSTMRKTNFNAPGPEAMGGELEFGVPVFYKGLYPPPNEKAFVVWEDPSYLEGQKWSPFQSWHYFRHFIRLILKNAAEGLLIFESFSTLALAIVMTWVLLIIKQTKRALLKGDLLYSLFTLALFTGGYMLFHFEQRYLWLSNILLLLMGGHVLHWLLQQKFFGSTLRQAVLVVFFIASFIFTPSRHILQAEKGNMDQDMYYMAADLKHLNISGSIASNREDVPVHDAWHKTFRLAYLLDSRYYGQVKDNISDSELEAELQKYNIDYYFIWGTDGRVPQFLTRYRELTGGEISGLKVFSLDKRTGESAQ